MSEVIEVRDVFTGHVLCSRAECQWQTPDGPSGIEARFTDEKGRPVCGEHRPVRPPVRSNRKRR